MNTRLQLYKKNRLAGMSAYRAAINAGYSHAYASHATKRIEKGRSFKDFLTKNGLDDDAIAKTLKEGLEASKKVSIYYEKKVDGETEEEGYEVSEEPDHANRHKFLDTLLELRGDVKRGGSSIAIQNNNSATASVKMETIQKGGKPLEFRIGSPDPA